MAQVFGLNSLIKKLLDDDPSDDRKDAKPKGPRSAGAPPSKPRTEKERQQAEIDERRNRGQSHIQGFVREKLNAAAREEEIRLTDPAEDDGVEVDNALIDHISSTMQELWEKTEARISSSQMPEAELRKMAQDYVWSVYIRDRKPADIKDMIYLYLLAGIAWEGLKHKVDEPEYFHYFFRKTAHLIVQYTDQYGNNLLHYIIKRDRQNVGRALLCLEAMCRAAKERHGAKGGDKDERDTVKEFFMQRRNKLEESIARVFERLATMPMKQRFKKAIDGMYEEDEGGAGDGFSPGDDPSQAVRAAVEKPKVSTKLITDLVAAGETDAAAFYTRLRATDISPADLEKASETDGVDLFALDQVETPKDAVKGMRTSAANIPGALSNQYAKNGIFNLEFARKKLVRIGDTRSQGKKDERGYNIYMQMAEHKEPSDAYLRNEHDFWDTMFEQLARQAYAKAPAGTPLSKLRLAIARDILDMPGNDGRTSLHLAAISGNMEVMRFYLENVLIFEYADAFKKAQGMNTDPKKLAEMKKRFLVEMRDNLSYLMSVDNENYNCFMHAIENDQKDLLTVILGTLAKHPEYLDVISSLNHQPKGELHPVTLQDFAERAFGGVTGGNETGRYLQSVLRDVEKRRKWKQDNSRTPGSASVV